MQDMRIRKYFIALILLMFDVCITYSQETRTEIGLGFRVNSTIVDTAYSDNASRMRELIEFLERIRQDSTVNIVRISFKGAASPEGSYQLNRRLAHSRLNALEELVRNYVEAPDSIITRNDSYIPWEWLKSQIETSGLTDKDKIISILEEESMLVDYHNPNTHIDSRILKLKQLDNGMTWREIHRLYFQSMRNACAEFITYTDTIVHRDPVMISDAFSIDQTPPAEVPRIIPDTSAIAAATVPETPEWTRRLHLKTNIIGLGFGIANASAELDIAKHCSFALPVYYSAWDYFKTTIKFRTFTIQPEIRYWISENNDGFYAGVHFGLSYYNYAFDREYRYQDHNRETPAIGGGLSLGYRLPLGKSSRWRVEFSLGAGVYPLHYDKFHNTPETKYGLMTENVQKTYWGIDQAAISFSYAFNLKRKGGGR